MDRSHGLECEYEARNDEEDGHAAPAGVQDAQDGKLEDVSVRGGGTIAVPQDRPEQVVEVE